MYVYYDIHTYVYHPNVIAHSAEYNKLNFRLVFLSILRSNSMKNSKCNNIEDIHVKIMNHSAELECTRKIENVLLSRYKNFGVLTTPETQLLYISML